MLGASCGTAGTVLLDVSPLFLSFVMFSFYFLLIIGERMVG